MAYKDELKTETDLVALISQYTALKRSGDKWIGRCPHPDHVDKHPSFYVYFNDKGEQVWYCFGCCQQGANWGDPKFFGNDCFGFLRWMSDYEGSPHILSFLESISEVRQFNSRRNKKPVVIAKRISAQPRVSVTPTYIQNLYDQEREAAQIAYDNLTPDIRFLLYERGLDDKDIEEWMIGLRMEQQGVSRISFPLFDKNKCVLGFIGRTVDDRRSPKYYNSPTSPIFKKKNYLYGLHRVESSEEIIVVEGVFDVILGYKYGMKNLVGCLCKDANPDVLKSWKKITLMLDNDESGKAGMRRAISKLREDHELFVCTFSEKDLGELAPKIKEGLVEFLNNHTYKVSSHEDFNL